MQLPPTLGLDRWGKGIPHDPRSEEIGRALGEIDVDVFGDYFQWNFGGDGDNGETLLYQLDIYFELLDLKNATLLLDRT